jgi:energy-coupling factor transport system ATP-binding protein
MKAIELKNVTFSYEGYEAKVLDDACFSVDYGEVALLSGYSGEGKSTVLSLISGIIPNVTAGEISGEVLIDGENISKQKMSEVCRKVGVVLQNAEAQIIQQIVEDEIAFGCENFAFPNDKIKSCINRSCRQMQLEPNWKTRTLSGGQKQRLITAATLATEQKILVLDEPLANLDKEGSELLMNTLRKLAKSGYAVLVVEHRLDMVLPFVDTVWKIRNGKIDKIGNKKKYLAEQAEYIKDCCNLSKSTDTILTLNNIGFSVKGRKILKDISFEIKRGERILLLGENGCGKTTLLRLIARLYKPTSGNITQSIDTRLGQKPKGTREWFKKVGIVYQNPNYQLFMPTVAQEVAFGAQKEEYAQKIMEMFGIAHLSERHPHSLSEGQKRRVSIAAVAASNPDILLLDEPTVGQDYAGLKDMISILNKLHEQSENTMITITHDMRCAEALCDHAVCIKDGIIADEGGKELAHRYFYSAVR